MKVKRNIIQIDEEKCTGCGLCEQRCQAGAMKLDDDRQITIIDLARCLGCGLCVEACPEEAVELRNKTAETIPPRTSEDMMEVIMANKA